MSFLLDHSALIRTVLCITGCLGAFLGPTWLPLIAMMLLALVWDAWEILIIGLLTDFLWIPGSLLMHAPLYSFAAVILVWGLAPLRREFLFR